VRGAVVFGVVVDPLSAVFGESVGDVDSDPAGHRLEGHLFVVVLVEVHEGRLDYLQPRR
jgi:hypothetical protein